METRERDLKRSFPSALRGGEVVKWLNRRGQDPVRQRLVGVIEAEGEQCHVPGEVRKKQLGVSVGLDEQLRYEELLDAQCDFREHELLPQRLDPADPRPPALRESQAVLVL